MKPINDSLLTSLLNTLQSYSTQSFLVAYSGGMDSHVLLHALAYLKKQSITSKIRAIHIDHGLQKSSGKWAVHCEKVASHLDIPCEIIELNLQIPEGESLEAVARDARYAVFKKALQRDEALLAAHHQDDQAETVLLQLFRGAGVDGLSAMPQCKPFEKGSLLRPLLDLSRQTLQEYAEANQLDYIDDPSNFNTDFDRNFLRHDVIPLLQKRWKGVNGSLSRVARLQAEAKMLLDAAAQIDLESVAASEIQTKGKCLEEARNTDIKINKTMNLSLSIERILELPTARQKALIRLWLKQLGFKMPSEVKLSHILKDVLHARVDAIPCVHWDNVEVRRYKNRLYAVKKLDRCTVNCIISWDGIQVLELDDLGYRIKPKHLGNWRSELQHSDNVSIRFRQGGEQIRLQGHKQTASLKKLMQAANIPPWERNRIPLIYLNEKLVMVYPYWRAEK